MYFKFIFRSVVFMAALLISSISFAQTRSISGVVKDSEGETIPGVSVQVKGTTNGSVTDISGKYTLQNVNENSIILFSFIGKKDNEIKVGIQHSINVVLEDDFENLDEVVVIGYGTQKKTDVTGAIATVDLGDVESVPLTSIEQTMQGRTAGVFVTQSGGGAPGGAMSVQIRGVGSVNASEPLYIIDGVPVQGGGTTTTGSSPLSSINPNNIESLQILKDASACAIYGSRASAGVVIITTKRGKKGENKIEFNSYHGIQQQPELYDVLGSRDYALYVQDANKNAGSNTPPNLVDADNLKYDTDWQDELFKSGSIDSYSLNISGGNEKATYSIGGEYFNQEGTMINTSFERISFNVNSDLKVGKKIKVGESLLISKTKSTKENADGGKRRLLHAVKQGPNIPVYDENNKGGYALPSPSDGHDVLNPIAEQNLYKVRPKTYNLLANAYAEVLFFKGLTYKLNLGVDFSYSDNLNYNPEFTDVGGKIRTSAINQNRSDKLNTMIENTLNYTNIFDEHSVNVMVGVTRESFSGSNLWGSGEKLSNDYMSMGAITDKRNTGGSVSEYSLQSFLGRAFYSYNNKYLLTATVRHDGSSKFAEDNRWSTFPSFSFGWRINEESFMKSIKIIDDMKIRAGYGIIGNQSPIGNYSTAVSMKNNYYYNFGGTTLPGATYTNIINPDLRWEETKQSNVGLDLIMLKNRLFVNLDYYKKTTDDMLLNIPVPSSMGMSSTTFNAGSVENIGFEVAVAYKKNIGDFRYEISGNLSTVKNEVTKLGAYSIPLHMGSQFDFGTITKTEVGEPIGNFYGYETDGIFQTQGEIDSHVFQDVTTSPGDIRFKNVNGDDKIDSDDMTVIGSPIPDFTYGLNLSASYKGFDMSMFWQGVQGNEIFNAFKFWTHGMNNNYNQSSDVLNRWIGPDSSNDMPRAVSGDPARNNRVSDRFVEDGSYLRLKSLSIGYDVKTLLGDRLKEVSKFRVYVSAQNLITFTDYSGLDPEVGSISGTATVSGIDVGSYPQSRIFTFGIQLGF